MTDVLRVCAACVVIDSRRIFYCSFILHQPTFFDIHGRVKEHTLRPNHYPSLTYAASERCSCVCRCVVIENEHIFYSHKNTLRRDADDAGVAYNSMCLKNVVYRFSSIT